MTPLLDRLDAISAPLLDAAGRGAVVLLAAAALSHFMRRRSAAARHLLWVGAVVVQLALPLFSIWGPRWDLALPSRVASVLPIETRTARTAQATPAVDAPVIAPSVPNSSTMEERIVSPTPPAPSVAVETAVETPITGRSLLLLLWLAGALFVLLRLAVGTVVVATLARRGARVMDGGWLSLTQKLASSLQIERPLTLLRGDRVNVPITWGIVYPVVLLPDDADAWPEERRRFVLVHEMAHVKRLDALTQLAGQLALALFWFDPLVWIANRRMQLEREHACDDYVLRHGTSATHYAEELLAMVRSIGTTGNGAAQPAFAALAMARRSEFEGRMLSILDPVLDRHPLPRGRTIMSALAALLFVVPLAALHPYGQMSPQTPPTSVPTPATAPAAKPAWPAAAAAMTLDASPAAPAPQAPTAPAPPAAPRENGVLYGDLCDKLRFDGTVMNQVHSHSDDDDGSRLVEYGAISAGHCARALISGAVSFNAAEDDVVSMPLGTQAVFRERSSSIDRVMVFTRGADGAIARTYSENGGSADYDAAARRWFAAFLPMVLTETGVNVGPRVAKWRSEGGVENVLRHVERMKSGSAKRSVFNVLLTGARLTSDEMERTLQVAGRSLSSSGDLRAVLSLAAPQARGARYSPAIEKAIDGISSSGDRTAVLMTYGETDDREMLQAVMRMAKGIGSSGDLSRLLVTLQPRYLNGDDRALRTAYFARVADVPSSGDLRRVLTTAVSHAAGSTATASAIIAASADVASSGDRAAVLVALANSGGITTQELRGQMVTAAAGVPSQSDRARVMQAIATTYR